MIFFEEVNGKATVVLRWKYDFYMAETGEVICRTDDRGDACYALNEIMYKSIREGVKMPCIHYKENRESDKLYREIMRGEHVMRMVYENNMKMRNVKWDSIQE